MTGLSFFHSLNGATICQAESFFIIPVHAIEITGTHVIRKSELGFFVVDFTEYIVISPHSIDSLAKICAETSARIGATNDVIEYDLGITIT